MQEVADIRPGPPGPPLVIASLGLTGVSFFIWAGVVFLEALGGYTAFRSGDVLAWLLPLLALPAATLGSLIAWSTRRWWPFFVGVAITFILPALLAIVLASPPAEPFGGD